MQHSFSKKVAEKYGIKAAIILKNIYFWIEKNKAETVNFFDGEYWTFGSLKGFCELFPYLTPKEIRNALDKLKDEGILLTGNYNKSPYNKTTWYALTDLGKSICSEGQIDMPVGANRSDHKGTSMKDINKDISIYIKREGANAPAPAETDKPLRQKKFTPPTVEEVRAYCLERKNNIDPEAFWDYYEARGWELTKGRKMKDWRACVRTWEKKNFDSGGALNKKQKWREQKDAYIHGTSTITEEDLFRQAGLID